MFNRGKASGKKPIGTDPIATILGEGTAWHGEIQAGAQGLRIEGTVEGTVLSEGHVVVAPTGLVRGTIHARNLTVTGRIEGIFKVEGCLEILGTGWVEGDVEMDALVVDEGGTLVGSCLRREPSKPKEPLPLMPRREEPLPERPLHTGSGTHGAPLDPRSSGWNRH